MLSFGLLDVFFSMLYFFLFFVWIMLLFRIFADIFRDKDASGISKVLWIVFLIVLPFLGAFLSIVIKGNSMAGREVEQLQAQDAAARQYIRQAAAPSATEELARLAELKEKGVIDDAEFAAMKAKIVG
jgi:cytochrome bd-type quinol oxidase subunit 2